MYHSGMSAKSPPSRLEGPLSGAVYALLWFALGPAERFRWMLPFGLRFAVLLVTPLRQWPWLLGGELVATALVDLHTVHRGWDWLTFLAGDLPVPLTVAAVLAILRRASLRASLRTPEDTTRLFLSIVLAIAATAAVEATTLSLIHQVAVSDMIWNWLGQQMLDHYVGTLLVAPLVVMLARARPSPRALAALLMDGMLVMLPTIALLLMLARHGAPQPQLARVLALAPVLFFAFRHGWRGASLALSITSLTLATVDHSLGRPVETFSHLFLAIAGTGALMLGSACDALRRTSVRLAEQNRRLEAANRRLDRLTRQLRQAARGNLQSEENLRRHLAAELHDEFGQNIAAIQTRLKLVEGRLRSAGIDDLGTSIHAILVHMRRVLHRVMDDLRPAVLDEFGLFRALEEGPIRELLHAAGMQYTCELRGDARLLDEETGNTIYRLVQESATNAVRHAGAGSFRFRLRIGRRHGAVLALLDIRDDGVGLPEPLPRGGRGLQGMRDRVLALGGLFTVRRESAGTHLRILLVGQPPPSWQRGRD